MEMRDEEQKGRAAHVDVGITQDSARIQGWTCERGPERESVTGRAGGDRGGEGLLVTGGD